MSAPLKMDAAQVTRLGRFLTALTEATRDTHVNVCPYQSIDIRVSEASCVRINWDEATRSYLVDDRNGD